jgi:chemotaxis protein methyltransferase CheR
MQRLHRDRQTRNIPVVVVADTTDLEYELQHAFDFILKPVDMARMREDIAMLTKGEKKRSASIRIEHLSESDYKLFHDYLVAFSGLHYERRNQKLLERGLLNRMTSLRITSYLDYFDYLIEHHDNRQELQKLLQQLTIGETYFFRYNAHYLTLKRLLNGELAADPKKRVRIWSAGCSTGEEPYSIAMTIMEIFPDWRERDIRVIATDINNRSLRRAREGVYSQWAMRVIDHHYVDRYFRVVDNRFHIRDEVKQLVDFSHLNLQTANFPVPGGEISNIDVIFCRNVMMYFSLSTIKEIVGKFASSLTANGHFFLGHAETLSHVSSQFERHTSDGGFYYRKRNQQQQASVQREKRVVRERPQLRAVPRQPEPPKPKVEPVVVVSSPPKGTEELFHEAMELFDTENFTAAAKHVEEVLKKEPEHCGAMVLSGFMLANSGNIDEALAICQKVLAINDLLPEAYYLQGLVHDIADQCAEALAEYRKAVLLNMEFLMAHHNLWRLYMRLGKEQQGLRELRTCLKILERTDQEMVVPFSGGLTREVFLEQLRHALANVA